MAEDELTPETLPGFRARARRDTTQLLITEADLARAVQAAKEDLRKEWRRSHLAIAVWLLLLTLAFVVAAVTGARLK